MGDGHVRPHDPGERVSAVSGAAAGEQGDLALVWRMSGRVDDLHAVFPDVALCRLCLRPSLAALAGAPQPGLRASGTGGGGVGDAAHRSGTRQQTGRHLEPHVADSAPADDESGAPLFRALGDQPAGSSVVQQRQSGPIALPALRPVEHRLLGGVAELPVRVRAGLDVGATVAALVGGLRALRRAVRGEPGVPVAIAPSCLAGGGQLRRRCVGACGSRPHLARPPPLAGVAGVRLADALGGHESYLPGRGRRAVPLGVAPDAVPVEFHHLVRPRAMVRSPGVGRRRHPGVGGRGVRRRLQRNSILDTEPEVPRAGGVPGRRA